MKAFFTSFFVLFGTYVSAQYYTLEEWETTENHFANVIVENKPAHDQHIDDYDHEFLTVEGLVSLKYDTIAYGCNRRQFGAHCPDFVVVEPPEGVVAIPNEAYIPEDGEITIRLYRWLGV